MDKEELGRLYPITLVEYNDHWPTQFEQEQERLKDILGHELALRVEHIGSTAIPGLSAKPTVDILVEIPEKFILNSIIKKMTAREYIHMKEQKKHLMFVKGYSSKGLERESFHIHMGPKDQSWLWDRIYFRDYLRKNKKEAMNYEKLKTDLATKNKFDREAYTEAKEDYIIRITLQAKKEIL